MRGAATHITVAMPAARAAQRSRALALAAPSGLPVLTVPSADELRDSKTAINRVRDIEPDDLLGREPVQLDEAGIAGVLAGKTVLITGAGGSIGSELCRQVARFNPARLVLYELSEFNLYSIEQDLGERFPGLPLVRVIGDVKDLDHLHHTCGRWPPQVVFHAAAFKHVPLMEEEHNTLAAWYVRAANPQARREALTSRPLLLAAVGRAVSHAGQTLLYLTPMHAEVGLIKSMIANVHAAISYVRRAAEQLPKLDHWRALVGYICQRIVGHMALPIPPPALAAPG